MFDSSINCKGDGDSEIALVVEDEDFIQSTMDGHPYRAARFAASLRRKLFRRAYSPLLKWSLFPDIACRASRLDPPAERDITPRTYHHVHACCARAE
jgi:hypothetical protein